jgi:hypothetical protein
MVIVNILVGLYDANRHTSPFHYLEDRQAHKAGEAP